MDDVILRRELEVGCIAAHDEGCDRLTLDFDDDDDQVVVYGPNDVELPFVSLIVNTETAAQTRLRDRFVLEIRRLESSRESRVESNEAEVRSQRSEVGGRRSEVGGQKSAKGQPSTLNPQP